ncbi:alpha,alpha-trehalase nth1 [Yamadazyma tenuis]|uniref:Trehalase n=1 Tax=Candida tenuis (strain ATCC 10573 / BCRC 21748 / CBS 615 / JCM 9827 / NBRC 10315 / NRRL Y-1498 / VKM Y-70) TaxID=590646 RepID=G3BFV6_CANTC|nr:uncharacterized protein CANTEDRAFT_132431 [Yamadazyma tenuis ATCC 10573]EGV60740.1 hypothetical protein CANTEDRAFT_132431 [Yamadazyma tenuis ATCC 10573]WEJ93990.1 alpha,alpha-trehalase nth1 [Yamadazyma tenuis]
MSDSQHKRTHSSSSEFDPFEDPEDYYSNKNVSMNRARTFSVFESSSTKFSPYSDDPISERSHENTPTPSDSLSSTPAPEVSDKNVPVPMLQSDSSGSSRSEESSNFAKRPSIVPVYDESFSSTSELTKTEEEVKEVNERIKQLHLRRSSWDDNMYRRPKKFYIPDVDTTLTQLLNNEDTDHNCQITIEDTGPKVLKLGTANSNGYKQFDIRGTYMLSNLLQELTIAKRLGKKHLVLDEQRLSENPVFRMKRLISTQFWKNLTRQMTKNTIMEMAKDTKIPEEYINEKGEKVAARETHRIYVPHNRADQFEYFMSIKKTNTDANLDVQYLPEVIDAKFIRSINKKPGLLALQSRPDPNDPNNLINEPYVVPGGRFNELYGWDSYMESLGLLVDVTPTNTTNLDLAKGMTENFIYEINHYGKVLNANRSYYLGRSQPPFLTDMALRVFNKLMEVRPEATEESLKFLERAVKAAIIEYKTIWTAKPRYDDATGLSCYHPEGLGVPPETESSHFVEVLKPYTEKYNVSHEEFIELYNSEKIKEPALDEYFLHDRAVRESGHDTSYRLEGKCAYLATVDLNSLLYKYEVDIAFMVETYFHNSLQVNGVVETKSSWLERATIRKQNITKYLWNEKDGIFYDYHIKNHTQTGYESATTFWPLWSKAASPEQASRLVKQSLHKFEEFGGLVAGTEASRGAVNLSRPSRQWDYPYGWAPQQILAWIGLANYGFDGDARRLIYRWLYLMTKAFADYNGVVVEKYNVVKGATPHKVDAEYGNQGADFKGVATEGFGWVNASYMFGLTFLNVHAIRNIGALMPPDVFLANMHPDQRQLYE